ncbi:MAG: threonylcarbamoyl-AMP synthase [Rikenellaceae bacterium]|jgi:tRNA threonylcarbamoyl adenosine modification protein (Sua5/YciO/YrdC/YwlC family)|nr:threonylcarbamoyl-AMP synthase [Rikenellaceae bacterium]
MIVKIYPDNPNPKAIERVVAVLESDGVIVYPTDTVYAFGCSLKSPKAIERLKAIRGKSTADMAVVFADLSHIADYARVDNPTFKILKRNLPGPFTFILKASGRVPDKLLEKRKTIGVRIPENPIPLHLIERLEAPLITASVKDDDDVIEYTTDPELIDEKYGALVDLVLDGGFGNNEASTVVDCSGEELEILRQGLGELQM